MKNSGTAILIMIGIALSFRGAPGHNSHRSAVNGTLLNGKTDQGRELNGSTAQGRFLNGIIVMNGNAGTAAARGGEGDTGVHIEGVRIEGSRLVR